MDADTAVAAAYSSGEVFVKPLQQQKRPRQWSQQQWPQQQELTYAGDEMLFEDPEEYGGLPNVDDLEVAAAAAAATMEAVQELAADSSEEHSSQEDESSGEEESSSGAESSSEEDEEMHDAEQAPTASNRIAVSLEVTGEDNVRLHLVPQARDDETDSNAGSEAYDADVLRDMLERMTEDGEDARAAAREAAEEAAQAATVQPLDVEITAEDVLLPAGHVSSLLGSRVIVQVDPTARPVDEGSVLCLAADRAPLGRIEEVFGPIHAPLYALRYAGGGEVPAGLTVGAAVSSVERFNEYLMPEAVQEKARDLVEEDAGDEFQFSDDEAEAVFRAQYGTSDPEPSASPSFSGRGRGLPPLARGRGRHGPGVTGGVTSPRGGRSRPQRGRGPPSVGAHIEDLSLSSPRHHGGNGASPSGAPNQGSVMRMGASPTQRSRGRGRRGMGRNGGQGRGWGPSPEPMPLGGAPPPGLPQGGQWVFIPASNPAAESQHGIPQPSPPSNWAGHPGPPQSGGRYGPWRGDNGYQQNYQPAVNPSMRAPATFQAGRNGQRGGRGRQQGAWPSPQGSRAYQAGGNFQAGGRFQSGDGQDYSAEAGPDQGQNMAYGFGGGYDGASGQQPSSFYPEGLP